MKYLRSFVQFQAVVNCGLFTVWVKTWTECQSKVIHKGIEIIVWNSPGELNDYEFSCNFL